MKCDTKVKSLKRPQNPIGTAYLAISRKGVAPGSLMLFHKTEGKTKSDRQRSEKMTTKKVQKHVYLEQENVDVLDELMQKKVGINTYSEAIRYIIDAYSQKNSEDDSISNQKKINAMSKNVDMLIELVAGGLHVQDVKVIAVAEETYVYQDAKRRVEEKIQKSTTVKSTSRKKISMSPTAETPKKESHNTYSRKFI